MILAGYFLAAWLVELAGGVDITPPCLWATLFETECPGCGLNTAGKKLMGLDLAGAWAANPMIYIAGPGIVYFIYKEVFPVKRKRQE